MFNIKRELYDIERKYVDDWYKQGKNLDDIKKAFETTILSIGKLSFPYINSVLENGELKPASKNNKLGNFSEREYNKNDVLAALRKKQNG